MRPMTEQHGGVETSQEFGGKPKYSGGRDYSIGAYGRNGFCCAPDIDSDWSEKDARETGLNMRKPL